MITREQKPQDRAGSLSYANSFARCRLGLLHVILCPTLRCAHLSGANRGIFVVDGLEKIASAKEAGSQVKVYC